MERPLSRWLAGIWAKSETHPRPWLLGALAMGLGLRVAFFALKGVSGEDPTLLNVARSLRAGRGLHGWDLAC